MNIAEEECKSLIDHCDMYFTENDDGSMDISIAYDEEFRRLIRKKYNRKRCTKKLVEDFFQGAFDTLEKLAEETWDDVSNNLH